MDTRGGIDEAWDAFVARTPGGSHVQTSRWAAVKEVVGWRAVRVLARSGGEITGGCQLLTRQAGPATLAYAPRGPLCADAAVLDEVLDGVFAACRGPRPVYLKVQPPAGHAALGAALERRGFAASTLEAAPVASVLVDLEAEPDALLARMRSGVRANIRKAQRRGVTVRHGDGADLDTFMRLVGSTGARQGFDPYPPAYWRRILEAFEDRTLLVAAHEGEPLTALLVVGFGDTASFKMGGWDSSRGGVRPNELAHWTAMQWARERGYRYYDFEGFEPEVERAFARGETIPEAETGVTWFKRGFGGDIHVFPPAYDSTPQRWLRPAVRAAAPRLHATRGVAMRLLGRR